MIEFLDNYLRRFLDNVAETIFAREADEFFYRRGKCFARHWNIERVEFAIDGNGQLGRSIAFDDADQVSAPAREEAAAGSAVTDGGVGFEHGGADFLVWPGLVIDAAEDACRG